MNYKDIFEKLWIEYIKTNPHAERVHDLFVAEGEEVINDHIAFRTFNSNQLWVASHFSSSFSLSVGKEGLLWSRDIVKCCG